MQYIPTMFFGSDTWDKSIEFILVGGGGSGNPSGGGAGGFITGSATLDTGSFYTFNVGRGGIFAAANFQSGSTSYFLNSASIGGGAGGFNSLTQDGGSGGGPDYPVSFNSYNLNYGTGVPGQGNRGGRSARNITGAAAGGGGGGAKGAGGDATYFLDGPVNAGDGGNGYTWLDGVTYAGGGGGTFLSNGTNGVGGSGGGGNAGQNGVDELGGGAGASTTGYGGDGILKLRYPGSRQRIIGGSVTKEGGYTYHTFTTSGSFYVIQEDDINRANKYQLEYLLVGGGGGGGGNFISSSNTSTGGGGGGGAVITGSFFSTSSFEISVLSVGAGGAGGHILNGVAQKGGDTEISSSFIYHLAEGGGRGGYGSGTISDGGNGGSGGGVGTSYGGTLGSPGTGSIYGNNACPGYSFGASTRISSAGAGWLTSGSCGTNPVRGGYGFKWQANHQFYGSGGGAASTNIGGGIGGPNAGGGGRYSVFSGTYSSQTPGPSSGVATYGGGGGGSIGNAGDGGSGVFIIRYAGNTALATGGTITYENGYVYHTFTTTGSFNWQ